LVWKREASIRVIIGLRPRMMLRKGRKRLREREVQGRVSENNHRRR